MFKIDDIFITFASTKAFLETTKSRFVLLFPSQLVYHILIFLYSSFQESIKNSHNLSGHDDIFTNLYTLMSILE